MSLRSSGLGVAVLALLALTVMPAIAAAGGNSNNAHMCHHGGWQSLYTSTGATFTNQGGCVAYGAHGGTVVTEPPYVGQSVCESAGGTFSVGGTVPIYNVPAIWTCGGGNLGSPNAYPCVPDGGNAMLYYTGITYCFRAY